ncbi:MAG: hypothetical protein WAO03_08480 [Petrimonas mucosa]
MYKVVKRFRDKHTKVVYSVGDSYASDENRLKELSDKGYIEGAKASSISFGDMTKKELMQLLKEKGVECNDRQTKAELIGLLGGD